VILFSISIIFLVYTYNLISTVNIYFGDNLRDEKRRIKMIFIAFSATFTTQAVYSLVSQICLNRLENFNLFLYELTYFIFYIFWDIYPLALVMHYHYFTF